MRQLRLIPIFFGLVLAAASASAQPVFVNGIVIPAGTVDATGVPGANQGRFGHFSDLYYDQVRQEWWALSDRGPGGGLLDYSVRLQQVDVWINSWTGAIDRFKILKTIVLRDPSGLLSPPSAPVGAPRALNGLNPLLLNGNPAELGRSFDPEGLVVDPTSGNFLIADEYGPSLFEFDRNGRLIALFHTPDELLPKQAGVLDYVAVRDGNVSGSGRQDNRGFEGLAISPDGKRLFAVLQDPLLDEGPHGATDTTDNDGRDGRNVRIVVFDNDSRSRTYRESIAQYAYQLEPQAAIRARILAQGGTATGSDPRQGRNIGLSAILALNDHEFLVLERDNRGIGVDNPAGRGTGSAPFPAAGIVGSKRIYKIDLRGATDVAGLVLPDDGNLAAAGIVPVQKNDQNVYIDLAANTLLPNGNQAEKWEGFTIGPKLFNGAFSIVAGNDNDYSVTQTGAGEQFDIYVDFKGNVARCVLDDPTRCEVNPLADDFVIDNPVKVPAGFSQLPGVLHAYKASAADMAGYVMPRAQPQRRERHDRDKR